MDSRDLHRRLLDLIDQPISPQLLSFVSHRASLVIASPPLNHDDHSIIPSIQQFVPLLVQRSCVSAGTLIGALVYLDRLQRRVATVPSSSPCSCQRIFLATLIVTTKVLHDTSPKNRYWARYTSLFPLEEVNIMERQFLSLMDFQLSITLDDLFHVLYAFEASLMPLLTNPFGSPSLSWEDDPYRLIGQKQKPFVFQPYRNHNGFSPMESTFSRLQSYSSHHHYHHHYHYHYNHQPEPCAIPSTLELSASSSSSSLDSFSSTDTTIYVSPPVHPKPLGWAHASPRSVKEPVKGKGLAAHYHKYNNTPARLSAAPTRKYPFEESSISHVSRHRKSSAKWLDPLLTQSSECLPLDENESRVFIHGQMRFNHICKN
ncbi:hypothetical protein CLU79DRAFT_837165 [Phycomyces nitens]|nr:hypothetical protein CLU79DRAFT_837165 [Phycomyces nitens]